jgi:acetolactate decarboxylase
MRVITAVGLILSMGVAACARSAPSPTAMNAGSPASKGSSPSSRDGVEVWGALRAVMHEGKTEANVAIRDVVPGPHSYAIGALSGLRGEMTIIDDEAIASFGEADGTVRTLPGSATGETATLLVRAAVPTWTSRPIEQPLGPQQIDEKLEALAISAGLDVGKRIPVLIDGTAKRLAWHVLGGPAEKGQNHHHGPRSTGTLAGVKVTLVGFFSRNDEGVFTHMGEHSHFHVVVTESRMTAHVDGFELEGGAVVRFPAR